MDVLIRRYHQLKMILLTAFLKILSCFQKEKHWVLHERCTDARDNAYFFYLYLKEKHPEQKVYYIIDKNSPDYHKVVEDAVQYGSLKNYWAIATAEKIISTHCYLGLPAMNPKLFHFCGLSRKFYFLQHGITGNYIPPMHYTIARIRMFFCAAKPEYDYIRSKYGYPAENVCYTGFSRFDGLHNVTTKQRILIMPTWRIYITDEESFLDSEYYRQWNKLLNDPDFVEYLEKNEMEAYFYPHFEMQKYLHYFSPGSSRIILANFANFDVQQLLKESKLLVTDYSSVFFDFAYMRKPIIYLQFDRDDFYGKHYKQGYFSYTEMGFGPVVYDAEDVGDMIIQLANNGFVLPDKYLKRTNDFYLLHDKNNCDRIYEAIRFGKTCDEQQ